MEMSCPFPQLCRVPIPPQRGQPDLGGTTLQSLSPCLGSPPWAAGFGGTHTVVEGVASHTRKRSQRGSGGPVTAVGSCGGSARAGEQQGGRQESTGGPYRGVGGRGRGLGVTFKDDLSPGSLQRLHSLIVGGIAEIDAVNSEDGVA